MDLNQYLKASSDTAASLADRVGVSAASISRIRRGDQNISLALAKRIVSETNGLVSFEALARDKAA